MPPFTFRRERHADYGKDEGSGTHGVAFLVLNLEGLNICHTALALALYILAELRRGERLPVVARYEEVAWLEGDYGVELHAAADNLAVGSEIAYHIVADAPLVEGVPADGCGRKTRYEFLILELLEREAVARFGGIVIAAHIGDAAGSHLHHDVVAIVHAAVAHICVGVVYSLGIGRRDDICAEHKSECRDYGG